VIPTAKSRTEGDELWLEGTDALSVGFAVFDEEHRMVAANQAFRKLRGYPPDICVAGTRLEELFRFNAQRGDYGPGDIEAHVADRVARANSKKPHRSEIELHDGTALVVEYSPIESGALLVSYADITDRKKAEKALKENEQRYALAMAGANEGMWDWVAGTNEIFISDSYKSLVNLDEPKNSITLEKWVSMIHPDDRKTRELARSKHFDGHTPLYECEYRVMCGNGQYRWFRDRAKSSKDEAGNITRMSGSLFDVTKRKQDEHALMKAHERIKSQNRTLKMLSNRLSKYLSPQVYDSIFSGASAVRISSKRKKLTVFFADIADFTSIAEQLEAEELTNLVNLYLTEMSAITLRHGGTIDNYIGDAIVGFFGDPETRGVQQDAKSCVEMAIEMQARMIELQQIWHDQGIENKIEMRVGINTGFCTVGNFGSKERMDYTIVGNEVNLASRLQSHAQSGGILVAHETFSLVKDQIAFEEQGPINVKGFSRPVTCYSIIGHLNRLRSEGRIIREYDDGIRIFLDLFRADRPATIKLIEGILKKLKSR
jgi:PAS domain S-box-containing protein